jgi:hypothetical protein
MKAGEPTCRGCYEAVDDDGVVLCAECASDADALEETQQLREALLQAKADRDAARLERDIARRAFAVSSFVASAWVLDRAEQYCHPKKVVAFFGDVSVDLRDGRHMEAFARGEIDDLLEKLCTRTENHDGPCNGLPGPQCIRALAAKEG